jgi:hypothetical protein
MDVNIVSAGKITLPPTAKGGDIHGSDRRDRKLMFRLLIEEIPGIRDAILKHVRCMLQNAFVFHPFAERS